MTFQMLFSSLQTVNMETDKEFKMSDLPLSPFPTTAIPMLNAYKFSDRRVHFRNHYKLSFNISLFLCKPLQLMCFLNIMVVEKLRSLGNIAFPILITGILMYTKSIISMLFLGWLGESELAGGSLAIGFANITGYSVLRGLAMGMEPICYQAYGARRWSLLAQICRQTLYLLLLVAVPISLLWIGMESLLLSLGQDPEITLVAKIYIICSIPDLVAQALFHPLRTFLRAQNINVPLTMVTLFAMVCHLLMNYFFVKYLEMGLEGVAIVSAMTTFIIDIGILLYILLSRRPLRPWDRAMPQTNNLGWKPLLALAGPSVLSVCLEWWWYELMVLLCGLLPNPEAKLASMGILIQITSLLYVFPSTLNSSLSTLIGQELGADQPVKARQTAIIGIIVAFIWGLLAFGLTVAVRDVWGKLYTQEPQILLLTSIALPIIGFCEVGNCIQTAACGILLGSGRPKRAACINFIAFYLIGLPVGGALAFKYNVGFKGFWQGLAAAQIGCTCMMVYSLVCTDWTDEARRARELTESTDVATDDMEACLLS